MPRYRFRRSAVGRIAVIGVTLVGVLAGPAAAQAEHYCGARFILHERGGWGASDFYVANVSCSHARHEVDRWFHHRQPRHIDGWTFSGGYTIHGKHGKQRVRCYLFGVD